MNADMVDEMRKYSKRNVGPVMLQYVLWILEQAQQRNISTLFFLARDGYLLREIAECIVKQRHLNIECKYLYCSRLSLRNAGYHLIDKGECQKLLLLGGVRVTINSLLSRGIPEAVERVAFYSELGFSDVDKCLSRDEFSTVCEKLRRCNRYWEEVNRKSEANYRAAIGYFNQEGVMHCKAVAVVDSGWTGSMQRSLRKILESDGYRGNYVGFYFGMYADPQETADGEYLTFYFDKHHQMINKILFNNNLFECMLSAPHGMTKGYAYSEGRYIPILAEHPSNNMLSLIQAQYAGTMEYVSEMLPTIDNQVTSYNNVVKKCGKILKKCMVYPTPTEIELLSEFIFCDDITESYHISLANKEMIDELNEYSIIHRVFNKLFHCNQKREMRALLWPYAVIQLAQPIVRPYYRFSVFVWEFLRFRLR